MEKSKSKMDNNPCLKEDYLVAKCFEKYDYKEKYCRPYADNARTCHRFWRRMRLERFIKSKFPTLPPPEEREEILRTRFKEKKLFPWPH